MTLLELEQNTKLKLWHDRIMDQKASGLPVITYCKNNNLNPSTFYEYVKKIKQSLCDEINVNQGGSNVVPFVSVPMQAKPVSSSDEKIIITKGTIKIEFGVNTSYQVIESVIKSLLC